MSDQPAEASSQDASKAPIFGSQFKFGQQQGFSGFSGVSPVEEPKAADDGEEPAGEEECQAEFKPVVQLAEVQTTTGEEDEEVALEHKAKLYRFDGEWKERGVGMARILKHKQTGKYRLLMREEKTLKVRANHHILPTAKLQEHTGNEKAWVWSTMDFAEEEQKNEKFCIRFGTIEKAQEFKKVYEVAQEANATLFPKAKKPKEESAEAAAVKDLSKQLEEKAKVEG
ncbi:unnamed protein product [Ostreobium quekettii]|uniref:RanBD1 domain-containing protein n=1 Tax=Ostreobium quekettii TaxID=121088 RepID=A0A8S1JDH7_9CHLO|nr:unnamed protein product [Ostreobium quekettii]